MTPLVSVIIPCYNQARFLPDALDSLLAQALLDWECIVVNDGSPDNTDEVASKYAASDSRIRLVNQSNRGLAGARNRGLDEAKGRYIQFLDADDLIGTYKLDLQVAALRKVDGLAVSYCDFRYCAEGDVTQTVLPDLYQPPRFIMKRPLHDIASRWETQFSIPCHCFLFDIRLFYQNSIRFDVRLPNHEDWDCWMSIFALDPIVIHVNGMHAIYRYHPSSMTKNTALMWYGFRLALKKQSKIFRSDPLVSSLLRHKAIEMRKIYSEETKLGKFRKTFKLRMRILYGYLARIVPWPVQKLMLKILRRN